MFNRFILYTAEPNVIKHLLVTKNVKKSPDLYKLIGYPFNERFLGRGILTEINNDISNKRRSLYRTYFTNK